MLTAFIYVPRIDKEVVSAYKDGLIIMGLKKAEVSDLLLNVEEKQAEEAFVWWKIPSQMTFMLN